MATTCSKQTRSLLGEGSNSKQPRALVISPNLDALLEHDERTRLGRIADPSGSPASNSPLSSSLDSAFPAGLPPPPRGPRQPRSPVSSKPDASNTGIFSRLMATDAISQTSPGSPVSPNSPSPWRTSTANPYINPAPSLAEVFDAGDQLVQITPAPRVAVDVLPGIREDDDLRGSFYLRTELGQARSRDDSTTSPPSPPVDARRFRIEDPKQLAYVSRPSKPPSLPRVDKFLNKGKNVFGLFSDATIQIQKSDSDKQPHPSSSSPARWEEHPGNLREARSSGQSFRRKDECTDEMPPSPNLNTQRQRTYAEDGNRIINATDPTRPRGDVAPRHQPLLSHGRAPTIITRYTLTDSPHGPTSTPTNISTTTYSQSRRSHPIDNTITSTPPATSPHSSDSHLAQSVSVNSDRESFIDLFSPSSPDSNFHDLSSKEDLRNLMTSPAGPRINLHESYPVPVSSYLTSSSRERSHTPKPPIPQTPKPTFNRSSPSLGMSKKSSPRASPPLDNSKQTRETLPPTTNFLNASERADLVRKSRKLAQVFGQTPGAAALSQQESGRPSQLAVPSDQTGKNRHKRGAVSMSNDIPTSVMHQTEPSWPPTEATLYLSANGRRHSSPLNPEEFSFLGDTTTTEEGMSSESRTDLDVETGSQEGVPSSDRSGHHASDQNRPGSPTSFIDLSDEETPDMSKRRRPSTRSVLENMTPEEQAEEERRRKRDKLAKLHRFLGSRVPMDLVLGLADPITSLPLPIAVSGTTTTPPEDAEASRKAWLRRRRSSSVVAFPSTWSDDLDRLKEDLNDREKAINVRRAQKMEKVFGVAPPQTLYHTRHSPSTSPLATSKASSGRPIRRSSPAEPLTLSSAYRNLNQSAYAKMKPKKSDRPDTSESNQQLLQTSRRGSFDESQDLPDSQVQRASKVYTHYQHSLNSLNHIIDQDDTESLVELHQYLNVDLAPSPALQEFVRDSPHRMPSTTTIKSERRRSLPARTSMMSIASEYSITTPKPDVTDFQLRRRRAAKLVQFFGADYRVLIQDVLESIEKGLEDERKRGTLGHDEAEELLQKLRRLKTKRQGIF